MRFSHLDLITSFSHGLLGYVGGSILTRLLSHPLRRVLDITALVRSEEKAEKLRSLGLKAVFGSTSDGALLASLAAEADIVFACVGHASSVLCQMLTDVVV